MFTDQLSKAFVRQGHDVTVIAPQSLTKCLFRHVPLAKNKAIIYSCEGKKLTLLRPKYLSAGARGDVFKFLFGRSYSNAISRAFKSIKDPIDFCMGEFWEAAKAIFPYIKEKGIPLFPQCGEEEVTQQRIGFSDEDIINIRTYMSGVVNVSTKNEDESREVGLIDENKTCVIPNGVDSAVFYPRNKKECREKLNIKDEFVVAFLGQFNSRKGVLRLDNALKKIGKNDIKVIYMGRGIEDPSYDGIIFKGTVMHDILPEYLSAADAFVLPTNNEGCANAVIEAMSCGLPIITSDLPFSHDILDKKSALLINPENEEEIKSAILKLYNDNDLRQNLALLSLEKAKDLTLERRVDKFIAFVQMRLKYN